MKKTLKVKIIFLLFCLLSFLILTQQGFAQTSRDNYYLKKLSENFNQFSSLLAACSKKGDIFKPHAVQIPNGATTYTSEQEAYQCPKGVDVAAKNLLAHISKNHLEDLDLTILEKPLESYLQAVELYQKSKQKHFEKLEIALQQIYKWQDYFLSFPILKFLQSSYRISLARIDFISKKYHHAEDHLLEAIQFLQDITRQAEKTLRPDFEKLELTVDRFLVLARRGVEAKRSEVQSFKDDTAELLKKIERLSFEIWDKKFPE